MPARTGSSRISAPWQRSGVTTRDGHPDPIRPVVPHQAMRAMNFGPLATVLAGGVRDDFELPDYGI